MRDRLKFAPEHIDPMLDGRKWATIRHGLDLEVHPGDRLALVDADSGEVFARATAGAVHRADATWLVRYDHEGHRSYRTPADLLEDLRRYYPEADLGPATQLTMIEFERVQQTDDYDLGLDPREPRPGEVGDHP